MAHRSGSCGYAGRAAIKDPKHCTGSRAAIQGSAALSSVLLTDTRAAAGARWAESYSAARGLSRLGHTRFPLTSEVRDNAEHPLDQHDLAAVMHLVLFHR